MKSVPGGKRLTAAESLERTRYVWAAVLKASGDLRPVGSDTRPPQESLRIVHGWKYPVSEKDLAKRLKLDVTLDKRTLPKTIDSTKGESAFESALKELHSTRVPHLVRLTEATMRRIYFAELKRRKAAGGWVPEIKRKRRNKSR